MPDISSIPSQPPTRLPFPPLTTSHILACSYHSFHPQFRSHIPKSRTIPLPQPFLDYLRSDGIILPSSSSPSATEDDSGYSDSEDEDEDVASRWRDLHQQISTTIVELGGKVVPKLNWSAPKDATWISATNDMECQSANDVYLLLKSSDFITHDLEHPFDGCTDKDTAPKIPYHLVLRKSFNLNPALEFRCFVRNRRLIAISQREMNYFEFLFELQSKFRYRIESFLDDVLLPKFKEENFVFDVYIPPPHEKLWLIDINPWAARTDPLLFSWLEILDMVVPEKKPERVIRMGGDQLDDNDSESSDEEDVWEPEFRMVQRDDPEAYQFAATKYSAHKLPKDVVDASMTPDGMKDMMEEWRRVMAGEAVGSDDD